MSLFRSIKYYKPHLAKYKWHLTGSLFSYGVGTIAKDVGLPLVAKNLFDVLATNATSASTKVASEWLAYFAVLIIAYNILYRIGDYLHTYLQSKVMQSLSDQSFSEIIKHSYSFFSSTFTGSLVSKAKRYIDSFETLHDIGIYQAWVHGIGLVSALTVLLWQAPLLGFMFFVWLVIFIAITLAWVPSINKKNLDRSSTQSLSTASLADSISNISAIISFAKRGEESERHSNFTRKEEMARSSAWFANMHQQTFQGFMVALIEIVAMVTAVSLWSNGTITLGTIVLMQGYLFVLFDIVWNIGKNATRLMGALTDADEMISIIETKISVPENASPEKCVMFEGGIEFKNVDFTYFDGSKVFDKLSIVIPAGQKVGLVGHSGAGKTTFTKLLLRLSDVTGGEILIDGQNIMSVTERDLRTKIAYVPQEPILFHRTIAENIAYGKPDATREEIETASKRAHAYEFILRLPKGFDTLVGERGIKLSGGERQRVAIARALLTDAPIVMLDEATSSLDSISEKHIQAAFEELTKGRTTLVVAHRLSTIEKMDRILVFERGEIIEDGTHNELIAKDGTYALLCRQQNHGIIEE